MAMIENFYEWWGDFIEEKPYESKFWQLINSILEIVAMYLAIRTPVKRYVLDCYEISGFRRGFGKPRWLCRKHWTEWERKYVAGKEHGNSVYIAFQHNKDELPVGVCEECWDNLRYAGGP